LDQKKINLIEEMLLKKMKLLESKKPWKFQGFLG
jgi:hypothetical protein